MKLVKHVKHKPGYPGLPSEHCLNGPGAVISQVRGTCLEVWCQVLEWMLNPASAVSTRVPDNLVKCVHPIFSPATVHAFAGTEFCEMWISTMRRVRKYDPLSTTFWAEE